MIQPRFTALCSLLVTLHFVYPAVSQETKPPYGVAIDNALAKQVMAAAESFATSKGWPVAITIVDDGGHLVMFQRLDNTQLGSITISQRKAQTAVHFRRPSKAFEERLAEGGVNLKLLALPHPALPMEGGLPIVVNGKVIGGIGVSGVTSAQDAEVARAGLKALSMKKADASTSR